MWLYFVFSLKWTKISEWLDFFIETELRLREGGFFIALRFTLWRLVSRGLILVARFRRLVPRGLRDVPLPSLALDVVLVVAGPDVLIEDCPVAALEGVLLAVLTTEMIDLTHYTETHSSRDC